MEVEKYYRGGKEIRADEVGNVIWSPQPKQAMMMGRSEYEALYGGAAGGGKTDYLVIEALRQVETPWYKGLILRRTFPQLKEIIDKAYNYYPRIYPSASYNMTEHRWTFPSGAKIDFGSLNSENDKYKYQGLAYDFIGFDELTHFTSTQYEYLKSRNRPNGPDTEVYIRSTANPGGVGHGWVKSRFVTAGEAGKPIVEVVRIKNPKGEIEYKAQSRVYIPASVFDNKKLMENDPNYVTHLAALPEAERNALLYGNWDSFTGQVFTEFRNDPAGYDSHQWTHVIKPFEIPDWWRVFRTYDFGYARPYAVGWYAVDGDGRMFRIRELYGCTSTPNEGVKQDPHEQARKIYEIEHSDPILKGRKINTGSIADPAIWNKSTGVSVAEAMEAEHIYFEPGDHERIAGLMQCHYRLAFDKMGYPMFQVFNTCQDFIRTIPNLVYDERNVEDVDTSGEDHIYDEWRYGCMANPIASRKNMIEAKTPSWDPLNQYHDKYGHSLTRTYRI